MVRGEVRSLEKKIDSSFPFHSTSVFERLGRGDKEWEESIKEAIIS
jgi:hypothetical protein